MRNQDLIFHLQNPSKIDNNDLVELKDLVHKFPFAGAFQLLLVKGLHNVSDSSFDTQLQTAAITVPQRNVLYQLLYAEKIQQVIDKVETATNTEEIAKEIELITDEVTVVSSQELESEIFVELQQHIEADEKEIIKLESPNSELQENILLEAINNSIQLDVDEWAKLQTTEEDVIAPKQVTEEVAPLAFTTPLRFSDWLLAMQEVKDNVEESPLEVPAPLVSTQDLIDKFISAKSKRIDVSKDPLTTKEMSKLSLVENEDFVTETLAGIYAKQGKFLKAIKIYQQLMLNFPEKSTFFASRIRFLREKMEYDNN